MGEHNLNAISPIDGRYASKTSELNDFFSEKALMKYRLVVEIEYFISLCESGIPELNDFDATKFSSLREIYLNFSDKDKGSYSPSILWTKTTINLVSLSCREYLLYLINQIQQIFVSFLRIALRQFIFALNYVQTKVSPSIEIQVEGSNGKLINGTFSPTVMSETRVWARYKVIRELVGLVTSLQPRAPTSTMAQA